jgi:hypothetical protein
VIARELRQADRLLSSVPFYPWCLAAFPVIRLYAENLTDVQPEEVLMPLLIVLGLVTVGMALLALILRDWRAAALIVSAVVVPILLYGLLRDQVQSLVGHGRVIVLVGSAALLVVAVLVALRARRQLDSLTFGLNVLSVALLLMVGIPAARGVSDVFSAGDESPASRTAGTATSGAPTRDIYHLVLDRYGSERALTTGLGVDNSAFIAWLREQGFQVLDDAHANYARTTLSLGSTLGLSLLDELAADMDPESQNLAPVVRRISNSAAGAFLQDLGYEYVHVASWFNQTRDSKIADRSYNPEEEVSFGSTLYDLSAVPAVLGAPAPERDTVRKHAVSAEFEFAVLDEIRDDPGPKYVFAHILLPHPPYVFLEDGTYAPRRATYESQLAYTNDRLKAFLEPLLALPEEERPIIILQADEGPFPARLTADEVGFDWTTATDEELITKFGILDARYLPGPEGAAPPRDDATVVNTYPELFRRYFGSDIPDQPDRVYASTKDEPYTMLDVTERLDEAERRLGDQPGG